MWSNSDPTAVTVPPRRRRRWFQFGLSTLLLATFCVAALFGWLTHERRRLRNCEHRLQQIDRLGGSSSETRTVDWRDTWLGIYTLDVTGISIPDGARLPSNKLTWLAEFPELRQLDLRGCRNLPVADWKVVGQLPKLRDLTLPYQPDVAEQLAGILPPLAEVSVMGLAITEPAEIRCLPRAKKARLDFRGCRMPSLMVEGRADVEELEISGSEYALVLRSLPSLKRVTISGHLTDVQLQDCRAWRRSSCPTALTATCRARRSACGGCPSYGRLLRETPQ
jgi:hypothetical protein